MLQYGVKTSTNVFCQYCPRREVLGSGSVLSSIRQASWPSPTTTLDRKRTSKERHPVWWVERVFFLFLFFLFCRAKLEYLLHTFTIVFCYKCPRRQGVRRGAGAKLPENRPPAHGTGRGPVNKGIMFGELSILLLLFLRFFRSVRGCMGMDVWVNVFPMPFLCADSGPWRKMSRAWPAMSAITTSSGSTCPSHQESAWGGVEAIQE